MIITTAPHTSYRRIWQLSWPVMVSNISLPLVGAVDVAMMGHLPDPAFVGGVALGGLVFNFLYLTFGFLRMGTTGLTALAAGAGKGDEVASVFIRGHLIAFICGFGVVACLPAILWLTNLTLTASADSLSHMKTYLEIRIWGLPATLANAVFLGSLFGLQKMRLCMVQLLTVNLMNILLNLLFVLGLGWEVAGVALASVCAEWVGLGLMVVIILRPSQPMIHKIKSVSREQLKDRAEWSKLMAIAKNLSLRTLLIWAVEALLISQAARIGDVELASIQIILVLFGFIAFSLDGFAHATEALTGQMVGNRNPSGLRIMIRKKLHSSWVYSCPNQLHPVFVKAHYPAPDDQPARAVASNIGDVDMGAGHSTLSLSCLSDGWRICWRGKHLAHAQWYDHSLFCVCRAY